jgi:hypothetical protein
MDETIEWAEDLPADCPPNDAVAPQNALFYRLVNNIPPVDRDFWSHRKLNPNKRFNVSECIARSCSVLSDLEGCSQIIKLPTQKNKRIVQLVLPPQSGLIRKTGRNLYHYSWWRAGTFDPISASIDLLLQDEDEKQKSR